jgi:hypothetical protein
MVDLNPSTPIITLNIKMLHTNEIQAVRRDKKADPNRY